MKNYFIRYNLKLKLNNGNIIDRDFCQSVNGYKAVDLAKKIKSKVKRLHKENFVSFNILSVEVMGYY
jgi:hypothetical protein